ncbi:ataxin-1-like [Callorhinchus milii]|uniref:Ataxin 1 like n=1 Tax=Callorhinchus milii TaxID=7868 RepID=A0A4W3J511_CALMI|nr:ataxin-1-like [Callorhinchus milii]XP_007887503.1 ataxin-1-like [Callorhinchus milii]XP_007887504.1 ataxin-1-like [Callorhinchus milii]|eukprot:gi/632944426/ref/XP_007887502.1/ PREDICTED: ataxin-1-like [Callorhinchus milii]
MKPTYERNQECLPPKKRELLQNNTGGEEILKNNSLPANSTTVSDAADWTGSAAGENQVMLRYGVAADNGESSPGVAVDQYGMMYKLAVPSASYSLSAQPSLVNVGHLSPAYSVASPLLQHHGVPYAPIHYTQIPHTSLQFVGAPYTVPYVSHGIVPNPLITPGMGIPTSHLSHLVPYPSVIAEGTPPPQSASPAQAYSKATGSPIHSFTPQAQLSHLTTADLPQGMTHGRVPVHFHPSLLTPSYAAFATAMPSQDICTENRYSHQVVKDRETTEVSSNRGKRVSDYQHLERRPQERFIELQHVGIRKEIHPSASSMECLRGSPHFSGHREPRNETVSPAQRSTPDTDLEVQQVVGNLGEGSQGPLDNRKEVLSNVKILHNSFKSQEQIRYHSQIIPGKTITEFSSNEQLPRSVYLPTQQHVASGLNKQQVDGQHGRLHKTVVLANGQPVLMPVDAPVLEDGSVVNNVAITTETTGQKHLDVQARTCPVVPLQTSHPTVPLLQSVLIQQSPVHIPSHFMKGAIIQLANGELKRVEDLQAQDFVRSAEISGGLKIDSSTLVDIVESQRPGYFTLHFSVGEPQTKVSVEVSSEHPFFVFSQGWSSCNPERTAQLFGLPCQRLTVGNVCISLSMQTSGRRSTQQASPPLNAVAAHDLRTVGMSEANLAPSVISLHTDRISETRSQPKDSAVQHLHTDSESSHISGHPNYHPRWSASAFQRDGFQSEEPRTSRPSFIPQEVKLSIEGRSNAGK